MVTLSALLIREHAMLKPFIWLGLWLILSMMLGACGNQDAPPPTIAPFIPDTTVTAIFPTLTPSVTPLRTGIPASTVQYATLPPERDLVPASATPRPMPTLAASITPAPSATSNLNPAVTPVELLPQTPIAEATLEGIARIEDATVLVEYFDLSTRLQSYEPVTLDDTLLPDTQVVEHTDEGLEFRFAVRPADSDARLDVTALVSLTLPTDAAQPRVSIRRAYLTDDPAEAYQGALVDEMGDRFQRALDSRLQAAAFDADMGTFFRVDALAEQETGIQFELTRP